MPNSGVRSSWLTSATNLRIRASDSCLVAKPCSIWVSMPLSERVSRPTSVPGAAGSGTRRVRSPAAIAAAVSSTRRSGASPARIATPPTTASTASNSAPATRLGQRGAGRRWSPSRRARARWRPRCGRGRRRTAPALHLQPGRQIFPHPGGHRQHAPPPARRVVDGERPARPLRDGGGVQPGQLDVAAGVHLPEHRAVGGQEGDVRPRRPGRTRPRAAAPGWRASAACREVQNLGRQRGQRRGQRAEPVRPFWP